MIISVLLNRILELLRKAGGNELLETNYSGQLFFPAKTVPQAECNLDCVVFMFYFLQGTQQLVCFLHKHDG